MPWAIAISLIVLWLLELGSSPTLGRGLLSGWLKFDENTA